MRVLVACEFSEIVKEQFLLRGHDAHSCDFLPGEKGLPNHHQCDVREILNDGWDLMIAHPPCTYLANSGVRWLNENCAKTGELYTERWKKMVEAANFFRLFLDAPIKHIAIENPIPHKYAVEIIGRRYDQLVQPYDFGEDASKATCLWLVNLPPLMATLILEPQHYACKCGYRFELELGKYGCPNCCAEYGAAKQVYSNQTRSGQNNEPPGENQQKNRSRTYNGIAVAMAEQWGSLSIVCNEVRNE